MGLETLGRDQGHMLYPDLVWIIGSFQLLEFMANCTNAFIYINV